MHPLGTRELEPSGRLAGSGLLTNTIGNPLETTIALSHLIFEGTLDRFPGLKICAAHGGGFLPSYAARSDAVITTFPNRVGPLPKKQPTQYLKDGQLYFDSIMFTPEGMRHLIADRGGPSDDRHRLPVSVEQGSGRPHHVDPRPFRRGPHRHPRRHRSEIARHQLSEIAEGGPVPPSEQGENPRRRRKSPLRSPIIPSRSNSSIPEAPFGQQGGDRRV